MVRSPDVGTRVTSPRTFERKARPVLRFDEQLSAKVLKRVGQLRRLGARGVVRTAYVRMFGPAVYSLTDPGRNVARGLHRQKTLGHALPLRLDRLKRRISLEACPEAAPLLRDIDLHAEARIAQHREPGADLVLGELGQDGTMLAFLGPIAGIDCVPADNFAAKSGTRIELIDRNGRLAVKTIFGSDEGRFIQTLEAMLDLAGASCAVPQVIAVDWSTRAILSAFVPGRTLPKDTKPSAEVIKRIEEMLVAIHRSGYVLDEIDFDSILFTADDQPMVADLRNAMPLNGLSRDMSVYVRDADIRQLNAHFGTQLITADSLRKLTSPPSIERAINGRKSDHFYAPVVIRDDIRWGKIWNTDVGEGRWNFIMKKHLPVPRGGSVLDLGSNNGFNPLQMLRVGAASAVGVEIDERAIRQGEFLKSAFEWLDNRPYDFQYIHGSQGDLSTFNLPRFDVVTALCSLYYLREEEMRKLVHYIRTITDVLVLQCNTDRLIDRSDDETYRKASVEFAVEVLNDAGFAQQQIIAPPGYSRPLVIGRA